MTAAYSSLNRTQKLAAFLILLGPESAGELLRHFNPDQLEAVAREMVAIPYVDPELRDSILEEFSAVVFQGIQAAIGGPGVTHSSLEAAKGDYMALKLMNRVAPPSTAEKNSVST
jgi:flagellar motor switch protein FliG